MSFLVAPCRDFDGAVDVRIGIDHARGFERIDDAERPIEPAGKILAFEMRARQQLRSGFRAGAEHIADAVDLGGEPCFGKPLRQPLQRAHMRLGESRLVNAGLVGADGAQRIEVGKDPGAIDVRAMVSHGASPRRYLVTLPGKNPAGNRKLRSLERQSFPARLLQVDGTVTAAPSAVSFLVYQPHLPRPLIGRGFFFALPGRLPTLRGRRQVRRGDCPHHGSVADGRGGGMMPPSDAHGHVWPVSAAIETPCKLRWPACPVRVAHVLTILLDV